MKLFKKKFIRRTYADDALDAVNEAWECLDASRHNISKIGDRTSEEEIELIQSNLRQLTKNMRIRNKGYFRKEE